MRFLSKCAIAVVPVHQHRDGLEDIGMTVSPIPFPMLTTPQVIPIPLDVAKYYEIEQSIVIEIGPGRARRPAASTDSSLGGDIRKCTVTIIAVELISAIGSYVK